MFKNLTYKRKNRFLIIGSCLLLIIAYQFSISETFELKRELEKVQQASKAATQAPQKIIAMKSKMKKLERVIGDTKMENTAIQQNLLHTLSAYCEEHRIDLTEFPQVRKSEFENYVQHLNQITLRGEFIPMLQLVNQFERNYELGKITSLSFHTEIERKTNRKKLYATLYLQNIQKV